MKSVGIGLTDRVEGPYDLSIHRIWATNGINEEDAEDEKRICGENALPVDQGVKTGWKSRRKPHDEGDPKPRDPNVKGIKALKYEWDKE